MIKLTKEEKANRYDSLQTAIKYTIECYKRRKEDAEGTYSSARHDGIIGAYSKGQADAFGYILDDLGRWAE